jgi:hypothetical protein
MMMPQLSAADCADGAIVEDMQQLLIPTMY